MHRNPYQIKNIHKLEAVQRRAIKLILPFYNLIYSERLQKLNLPSLRYRMDLIMANKILKNLVSVYKDYFLLLIPTHPIKWIQNRFNTSIRGHSFSQKIINDWNTLPYEIVSAPNVFIFKTKLCIYI